MNKKKLIIMCGPAGCGKTTWVQECASPGVSAHISRDRIRFDMVKEDEYYFSKEDAVYTEFCEEIYDALHRPWVREVYADATHLTKKAREKLIKNIRVPLETLDVRAVVIKPSVEQCLAQNAQRSGREFVPETVIKNMYESFEDPWDDDIEYTEIIYEGNWYNTGGKE